MKTVHELNQNELEELRNRLYHQYLDDGSLEEVVGENKTEEDIPMDFVKLYYEGTYFVEVDRGTLFDIFGSERLHDIDSTELIEYGDWFDEVID